MGKTKYYRTDERPLNIERHSSGGGWKIFAIAGGAAMVVAAIGSVDKADSTAAAATTKTAAVTKASVNTAGFTDLEKRCLKVGESARDVIGLQGNDLARMIAIAAEESSCRPNADNTGLNKDGTVDVCWAQINKTANADLFKGRDWHKMDDCSEMAGEVLKRQGWKAWSSYRSGQGPYREHVPMAIKLSGVLS